MKMVGKRIMVKQFQTKTVTKGGVVLPETTVQRLPVGTVECIGPDVEAPMPGQVVMFSLIGAIPVTVGKGDFVLIEPEDVLMILEEGEYDAS